MNPRPAQASRPDEGSVLSHAAGEDERVEAVHGRGHGGNARAEAMQVDIERGARAPVGGGGGDDLAHVARGAAEPAQPGVVLQTVLQCVRARRPRGG